MRPFLSPERPLLRAALAAVPGPDGAASTVHFGQLGVMPTRATPLVPRLAPKDSGKGRPT